MKIEPLPLHIVQSSTWGRFKEKMGNLTIRSGGVQFTLHKIPLIPFFVGYCPKISDPKNIDWIKLNEAGKKNRCICIRFDCPNIIEGTPLASEAVLMFEKYCLKAPKNTFAKNTVFLDIARSEEELLAAMHPKTRYNIHLSQRKGVRIYEGDEEELEDFIKLQKETAVRQGFFVHPDQYYREILRTLHPFGMVHLLVAEINDPETKKNIPIAAWMLFFYKGVLYYPYGGSDYKYRDLMASNLLMWEAIKLGKKLGGTLFDLWGVADNPYDPKDPWYGFTRFKLGFGGELVGFIDSYDLVISPGVYSAFNWAYKFMWLVLRLWKQLINIKN